jgi:hypothetical protein
VFLLLFTIFGSSHGTGGVLLFWGLAQLVLSVMAVCWCSRLTPFSVTKDYCLPLLVLTAAVFGPGVVGIVDLSWQTLAGLVMLLAAIAASYPHWKQLWVRE